MYEVNWVPLSVVTVEGTPNRAIHPAVKASATVAASISFRGTASSQREERSITVSRYF
jgi:hypothetical protein